MQFKLFLKIICLLEGILQPQGGVLTPTLGVTALEKLS